MSESEIVCRRQRVGLIFGVNFCQKKISLESSKDEKESENGKTETDEILKIVSKQSFNLLSSFDGKKWKWNEVTNCKKFKLLNFYFFVVWKIDKIRSVQLDFYCVHYC